MKQKLNFDVLSDDDNKVIKEFLREKEGSKNYTNGEIIRLTKNVNVIYILKKSSKKNDLYEVHRNHLDLHYMLEGIEQIVIGKKDTLNLIKPYNQEEDVSLGSTVSDVTIVLEKGFCIIGKDIPHYSNNISKIIRKFVFKVKCNS